MANKAAKEDSRNAERRTKKNRALRRQRLDIMNKKYSPDWRTQIERDKHRQAGELTWLDTYCYSRLGNIAPVTSTLIFTTIDCTLLMSQYPVFTVKNRELLPLLPLIELYRRIKPDLNLRG